MIGITDLIVTSTSELLIKELEKEYHPESRNILDHVERKEKSFLMKFMEKIQNEEKERIFEGIVLKIKNLKDPRDSRMDIKIEARYLQQASKEYTFSSGELVRYRGFIDTDNPIPMVTNLMMGLNSR